MRVQETSLGLITSTADPDRLSDLIEDTVVESVWVRDLPAVARTDPDAGQCSDPWWYLGRLGIYQAAAHVVLGTASIILGIRHPLVTARAATAVQVDTGGRFVLGVGSGGKPAMNQALGIAGRGLTEFAEQWRQLQATLRADDVGDDVTVRVPVGYRSPPVYLATSDLHRWKAIDGDADGWQTFLTDDRGAFDRLHDRVDRIRGAPTPTDVRVDVDLVPSAQADTRPVFTHPARGRVRCTAAQLPDLVKPWRGGPVDRILIRLSGHQAAQGLHALSDWW